MREIVVECRSSWHPQILSVHVSYLSGFYVKSVRYEFIIKRNKRIESKEQSPWKDHNLIDYNYTTNNVNSNFVSKLE